MDVDARSMSRTSGAPVRSEPAAAGFAVYNALLAIAVLFHQTSFAIWQERSVWSHHSVPTLVALWLLLRPASVRRFVAFAATQVMAWLIELPAMTNHWFLLALAHLPLLVYVAHRLVRSRRWPSPAEVYDAYGPFLRVVVLFLYAAATLAKLNTGFFDPAFSCAVQIYGDFRDRVPLLPERGDVAIAAIWGTVLVEGGLVFLLAHPRTRVAGVLLGGAFHGGLGLAGHIPFAGFAFAFYSLFLPPGALQDAVSGVRRRIDSLVALVRRPVAMPALGIAMLAVLAAVAHDWAFRDRAAGAVGLAIDLAFVTYAAGLAGVVVVAARRMAASERRPVPVSLRLASPLWAIPIALAVLNATMPYVGLKTHTSFAMYSNLVTEDGRWNHLVVPRAVQRFGFQDDVVFVERSSAPSLAPAATDGGGWVRLELQRAVAAGASTDDVVTYRVGDRRVTSSVAGDAVLAGQEPWLARKVFWFRPVAAPDRPVCRH